jgi:uncharacterized protein
MNKPKHILIQFAKVALIAGLVAGCSQAVPNSTPSPKADTRPAPTATQVAVVPSAVQPTPMTTQEPSGNEAVIQTAQKYLDLLVQEDYASAYEMQGPKMKTAFPESKMEETWKAVITQVGQFQEVTGTRVEQVPGYQVAVLTTQFKNALLDVRVTINPAGQVDGLFFAESKATSSTEDWSPPSYANQDAFVEKDVTVGSGEWALPGTLTLPKGTGPFPAVVLVHGSGPNDRDETIGPNKPFRDLAWGLASQGIAVLRYEKRTRQYGEKMAAMSDQITVKEETIDDALQAVDLLRHTDGIDPKQINVLGHSLGGMLVPRIGVQDVGIAGFVIMAGLARKLEDVVLEQYTYLANLDGTVTAEEQASLDKLQQKVNQAKDPKLTKDISASELPLNIPAAYWLDLRGYQPAEMAKTLQRPILVLQGGRDYQVTEADYNLWKQSLEGGKGDEFQLYPALNHLFIEGQGKITPEEYKNPGHVAEEVVKDIAEWIQMQNID